MKYEDEFIKFLDSDKGVDYYFKISYVNVIKGRNGDNYYEIFVDNLEDVDDANKELGYTDNKDNVIMERFLNYLDEKNIKYDFEEVYYNTTEYIMVYDSRELRKEV